MVDLQITHKVLLEKQNQLQKELELYQANN
jgi:hypothetical protein